MTREPIKTVDAELAQSIAKGLDDLKFGRVHDAADVFAELDAEFQNEDGEGLDQKKRCP